MVFGDGETRRRSVRNAFLKGSSCVEGGEAPSRRLDTSLKSAECVAERRVSHLQVAKIENKKEV